MKAEAELPAEFSPSRYIERVSLATEEVLDAEILPRQLLVGHHRDFHIVDIFSRYLMSRIARKVKDPEQVREKVRGWRRFGTRFVEAIARATGARDTTRLGQLLLGLKPKEYYFRYRRRRRLVVGPGELTRRLRVKAGSRLEAATRQGRSAIRFLLTGGTGFIGKEILSQASRDEAIEEVVVLVRPKEVRDPQTKRVTRVLSPEERGAALLRQLSIDPSARGGGKFRFVAGDIGQPALGVFAEERERLRPTLTHLVHCAANVSFDDTYESSFRANVLGARNALELACDLQYAEGSPFVAYVGIETAFMHGRQTRDLASEDDIVFPWNYYNNYYELSKAMASIETERYMSERGLHVTQLCPSIVIGEERTGNNRGDTKVVNGFANILGRTRQTLDAGGPSFLARWKTSLVAKLARTFPGDPGAEVNLVPVDRVAAGVLAALKTSEVVGTRIHLATDRLITWGRMCEIFREEVGVDVRLREPTVYRNFTLPLMTRFLKLMKQGKLATVLQRVGNVFGGYSEWGQPVHEVGKDVRVLGLPDPRPDPELACRMLCRHNRYVQEYGQVREEEEIARRERVWSDFIVALEARADKPSGRIPPDLFGRAVEESIDLRSFLPRPGS